MLPWWEILLRLGIAALAGGLIGLNRDLKNKPIGMRTLALVALASAMLVAHADHSAASDQLSDPASRVIQGILTGIGFLGAGVIMRSGNRLEIHGLTTAACTWLAAGIGIVCGAGQWLIVGVALVITFVVLIGGHPTERVLHHLLGGRKDERSSGAAPED
ncbi:MgtC/SapB family protein [Rhodopseudomonas sp. WA056]|uniref:MgtC/SapB family protein n=1 Tax=Rhodopseudomonas sp. WA056 TaxID=2269367 RepID=UPI0013E0C1DC|nr:MgtC/SapB family protein [Rhodopseudomonas sp. WA056]NEW85795.1 MgtC/SapB family protein [Rhodopseudomonas sp. WA056]